MLLHYLRVIFRNLVVDKTHLSINVFGLAVGIASILIIAQYVQFDLGFDDDFHDQDRIYYWLDHLQHMQSPFCFFTTNSESVSALEQM